MNNQKLKKLPDSVCKLQNLQTLTFSGCSKLQELPKGIRKLIILCQVHITTSQPYFRGKEIANFTSLENLRLYYCDKLESLSEGIQISSLKTGVLDGLGILKSLPFHYKFRNFFYQHCGKLDLSMGLGNEIPDSRLKKYLSLEGLPQLVTLTQWWQGSMNKLYSLIICGCKNLEELPDWLSKKICLKLLTIEDCPKLLSLLDNVHHATNLEYLEIIGCLELCKRYQNEVGQDLAQNIAHKKSYHS